MKIKNILIFFISIVTILFITTGCEIEINAKTFEEVSFSDASFVYDGNPHSIYLENVPEFATVVYSGNEKTDVGEYYVSATIYAEDYVTKTFAAKLTIYVNEFGELNFPTLTVEYDGAPHSVYLENIPEFATVTYSGNNQCEPGTYDVSATLSAIGYQDKTYYSSITITPKQFSDLVFEDDSIDYDGESHKLEVLNVPEFATVTYTNNNKKDPGTYTVKALVSASGYQTVTLTATLQINALTFSGVAFNDEKITYDGYYHSIYVTGLPQFATANYSGNNKCELGTYTVTAKVSAPGYQTLTLTATMKIGKFFPDLDFPDMTFIYDGSAQPILVDLSDIPYYTSMYYKIDGVAVDKLTVKDIGTYVASITLKNEKYGYEDRTYTATIKVVEQNIGTIDSTKQPYEFTSSLKYQELRNLILQGNYTITRVVSDDYFYPDSTTKTTTSSTTYIYVSNNEVFYYSSSNDKSNASWIDPASTITHIKVVGDEVLKVTYANGRISELEKLNASLFEENYGTYYGIMAMAYLAEGKEEGEIINGSQGGYTTTYGTFTIDEENNTFIVETRNHYYHTEFNHDEVVTYIISNVGNTKINMIDDFNVSSIDYSKFVTSNSCIINGIKYYNNVANVTFDSIDCTYVEEKEFILFPVVNGINITEISYEYYDKYYDLDLTGYTICVYFDENGYYQGEYSDLGLVKNYGNLAKHFASYGGTVKYYGEWE